MATAFIKIKNLDRNGLQTRAALDEATVSEYTELMEKGVEFPPVTVFREDIAGKPSVYRLADGFHRVESKTRTTKYGRPGFDTVKANIIQGGYADALKFALSANANHGLRRTNADKRRAVEMALENARKLFGGMPSANRLAEMCAVSVEFANRFITEKEKAAPPLPVRRGKAVPPPVPVRTRVGRDGKKVTLPPVRPAPPVRKGYAIGRDGKEHAIGVELDRFNVEVPEKIKQAFLDPRLNDWANTISRVKCDIQNAREQGVTFAASVARAEIELDNAFHELKAAVPYCVCRMCQGQGCKACHETGYQTKAQYDRNPAEFKCHQAE